MDQQPKVLLLYPPNQLMDIETPRPDGSLGPLYLAGALENAGFETDILDASVGGQKDRLENTFFRSIMQSNGLTRIGMSKNDIGEFVARGGYNIVGINSNFTPQTKMALEAAEAVKRVNPDILVIAGGVNARNLPMRFLKSGFVDIIALSESEKIIVQIVRSAEKGFYPDDLSGVIFLKNGIIVTKPLLHGDLYDVLDDLPFPAWHKLLFEKYDTIVSPHGILASPDLRYAPIMTSRGCPFRCAYCHISTEKDNFGITGGIGVYRTKSVDRVLTEIGILRNLGVKKLYFEDDSLLAKKDRVRTIFERVRGMGLKIADVNGVNLVHFLKKSGGKFEIDRDYLELLYSAGFDQIVFPVESASQRVLDKYATAKLDHKTLNVLELVRIARDIGILCPINMMIGFPDETEEEMMASVELGRQLVETGSPHCTFFIPIPFPGSALFDYALRNNHLDRDFDPDIMNYKNAIMRNTTVSPERIVEIRDWAWQSVNTAEHVEMRLKQSAGRRWVDK